MEFYDTRSLKNAAIFLRLCRTSQGNPDIGFVPAYYFDICENETQAVVGQCDLRVGANENTFYGGNIGYSIQPEHRGQHYAAQACKLLFSLAKQHGMQEVLITCHPDNLPSRKTCQAAGTEFVGIVDLPTHNDLYLRGERQECQYRISFHSGEDVLIRLAREEELEKISALYSAVHDQLERSVNYSSWQRDTYPLPQTAATAFAENTLYLLLSEGEVAATVILNSQQPAAYTQAHWSQTLAPEEVLVVHTLAVHPDFMHKGYGEKLLAFAKQFAQTQHFKEIRLDTYAHNLPAAHLYEKLGYQSAGLVDLGFGCTPQRNYRCYFLCCKEEIYVNLN